MTAAHGSGLLCVSHGLRRFTSAQSFRRIGVSTHGAMMRQLMKHALPPGSALLLVMRGPNAGSRFRLDGELTTAGRHPDSDIFLDDVTVSRRHAEFYREGARFTVRDVGSLNGTYVNRERIEEAELTGGDEVQIGKFRLLFLTSQDLGPGPSTPSADRRGRGAQDYA